jgi:hypothetical protein
MSDSLRLILRRIERANEQRGNLEVEMRAWAKDGAYKVVSQFDPKTGYTVFYVAELAEISPLTHSLIGEIIHALRTALDHLAYQLLLVSTTPTPADESRIKFPIYDDSKTTETDAFGPIKTLRKEIIEAIRKINPCKSAQPLLWILHSLDIVDKHRRIVICHLINHSVYTWEAMQQLLIDRGLSDMTAMVGLRNAFYTTPKTGKKAQVGDIVFTAPADSSEKMQQKLKFTFDIAFDEPQIIEGKSVIETLDETIKVVEHLITGFEPFLI